MATDDVNDDGGGDDDGGDDATCSPLEAPLRRRRLGGLVRLLVGYAHLCHFSDFLDCHVTVRARRAL